MKKIIGMAVVALMAVSAVHAEDKEPGNIGVGYQGIFVGNFISGLSLRYAPSPIGGQLEIGEGALDVDGLDVELLMLKGKFYYTLIQRENSAFYLGTSLGYYMIDMGGAEVSGWSIAPLLGSEYRFQGLPELGVNFEVSYEFNEWEVDNANVDISLRGIGISTGINYYF